MIRWITWQGKKELYAALLRDLKRTGITEQDLQHGYYKCRHAELLQANGAMMRQIETMFKEDTSMSFVNTTLTRRILNFIIRLHRRAVVSECEALDRRADDMFAAADQQKKVIAAENARLEAIRLDAVKAEQEADAAWKSAESELAQYPVHQ
jgi:hypothetical protein